MLSAVLWLVLLVEYVARVCRCHPRRSPPTASCSLSCNGRGRCMPMDLIAIEYSSGTDDPEQPADGFGLTYTNWEAERLQGCYCDSGTFGPSCEYRTWAICVLVNLWCAVCVDCFSRSRR